MYRCATSLQNYKINLGKEKGLIRRANFQLVKLKNYAQVKVMELKIIC